MQQHTTKQTILNKLDEFTRDITGLGNPIILGALGLLIYGWTQNTLTLYLIWIANEIFCSLIKYYAPTTRPVPMQYSSWIEKIEAGSFPSIHSSRWMVFVGFALAEGVTQANSAVFFVLFVLAILVGISRVILRKHYWRDVLAGWLIGFLFGWLIGQV
jgi:membrane-associated phospholipid phosphatase